MWWEARGKKVSSFLVSSFSSILAHWFNYCHFLHFALNLPSYPSCFSICSISLSMMPNLCMLIQLFSTSLVSYIKSLNIHLSGTATARYHHNAFKWNLKINTTTTRERFGQKISIFGWNIDESQFGERHPSTQWICDDFRLANRWRRGSIGKNNRNIH